eukprot:7971906-Pyramimonas_sp.AAC.3
MRELSNRQFREALRRIVATRARRESATIFRVYAITVGLKLTGREEVRNRESMNTTKNNYSHMDGWIERSPRRRRVRVCGAL